MNEREIFASAMQFDSDAEQSAFLDRACGGDSKLRARVEDLLREQGALGSFLESPALSMTAAPDPELSELSGTRIGPYKLLQKLGEGGMGVVYMAEQREPVERRVALKIIKPGMDTAQVIARFEAERQALAMMDHQNIARVLDAGQTESGRPFFVMELVKGVPITEYCDHNKLPPRERLELLLPVCYAIQHAHQKGIIHRDIKPSNAMVTLYDGKPVPKIIDFGVAKATAQRLTEKTMFTLYGQIVGTLEYMSPEQAEMSGLDIDTRSDIYSLGVLMYELLTGSTPLSMKQLRAATLPEMLRLIREQEPERPSTRLSQSGDTLPTISAQRSTDPHRLSMLLRGELDWIVLKALEKERTRRYDTAGSLARDIERYLKDEAVEACPPSAGYRLKKQLRKHRVWVATGSLVLASLVIGLFASMAMYQRAETSRQQADRARADELLKSTQLREALRVRDQALEAESRALDNTRRALDEKLSALRKSDALRLAAQSSAVLAHDPGLALVLAVESAGRDTVRTATQNNVLLAALAQCRETQTLIARKPDDEASAFRFSVTAAAFDRSGSRIVTLANGSEPRFHYRGDVRMNFRLDIGLAHVWDATGKLLATLAAPPDQKFAAAEVSPDGRWLVGRFANSSLIYHGESSEESEWTTCLYSDRVARIWDLQTGKETHVLRGHTDRLTAVRFSADSRQILTSSSDDTLRVWDVASGRELRVLKPESNAVEDAYFSPDGRRLLGIFHGFDRETRYADDAKSRYEIEEVDPPSDPERVVAKIRDGETGYHYRKVSFSGSFQLPGIELPLSSTNTPGLRLWNSETLDEIPVTLKTVVGSETPEFLSVQFANDPPRVVLGTSDGAVYMVSLEDGKQLARFKTKLKNIQAMSISRDELRLVVLDSDGAMSVVELADGSEIRHWDASEWKARAACFGPDGDHVFAVSGLPNGDEFGDDPAGKVVILNVATGEKRGWLRGHGGTVGSVQLNPLGTHVITASSDGTARVWRANLQSGGATVMAGFGPVRQALTDPDGKRIFVAAGAPKESNHWQGFGVIYDAEQGEQLAVLADDQYSPNSERVQHGIGAVTLAQFSHDGRRLLTVSTDRRVRMLDPKLSGADLFTLESNKWPVAEELPFTPVRVWETETGRELFALQGLKLDVAWASFSPDGEKIVTLCKRRFRSTDLQQKDGKTSVISSGSGSANDRGLVQIHIWDGRTGRLLMTLRDLLNPHIDLSDDGRTPLAISPDGKWLAITELLGFVDLDEQKRYSMPGIVSGSPPAFSPDGRYLLTYTHREASLLDLHKLKSNRGRSGGEMEVQRYGPDGELTAGKIPKGYSRSYETTRVGGHADSILSASFSPDSRWFATTSEDRTARIWSTQDGTLRHVLRGHTGPVRQVVFSADGQYVATRSNDRVIRVFLVDSGREWITLRGHRGAIHSIAFSADSQSVLSASEDGSCRLWPIDPLPAAIARRPRQLSREEQARFQISETLPSNQPDRDNSS